MPETETDPVPRFAIRDDQDVEDIAHSIAIAMVHIAKLAADYDQRNLPTKAKEAVRRIHRLTELLDDLHHEGCAVIMEALLGTAFHISQIPDERPDHGEQKAADSRRS